jgi:hypothetical protein
VVARNGLEYVAATIESDGEEANARLIAAAPQLLEAAEAVIDYEREAMVECTPDCGCAFCMLRAAVAAAKGEQQ